MLIPAPDADRRPAAALAARLRRHRTPPATSTPARGEPSVGEAPRTRAATADWTAVWETAANDQYFAVPAARRALVDALVRRLVTDRPSVPASYDEQTGCWSVDHTVDAVQVRLDFRLVDTTRQLVISRVSAD